ncbi:hypothetical protein HYS50_01435 [Candidatus Woesearchaeota archaeon]|nr:hypothetical protein [Candidatus Woesearchaeota archaeon]
MTHKSLKKRLVFFLSLVSLVFYPQINIAEENVPQQIQMLETVKNDGPTTADNEITFTGQCNGQDTKLIICRSSATLCDMGTLPGDLLCLSARTNETEKSCSYTPTLEEAGEHAGYSATCCDLQEKCAENQTTVDTWVINAQNSLIIKDDNGLQVPAAIEQQDTSTILSFTSQPIVKITFTNLEGNQIGLSQTTRGIIPPEGVEFSKVYGIDLEQVSFTEATLYATAEGSSLYVCKFWDFTLSTCIGSWEAVKKLNQNEEYTFNLQKSSFGFAETTTSQEQIVEREEPSKQITSPPKQKIEEQTSIDPELLLEPIKEAQNEPFPVEIGKVSSNGPIAAGSLITFTGSCTGENTRLLLCRSTATSCGLNTLPGNIICLSARTNESEKSCSYSAIEEDLGEHKEDTAVCCTEEYGCTSKIILIEPWTVTAPPEIIREEAKESEEDIQEQAEINKPVKWIKRVRYLENASNVTVKIHPRAADIKVHKVANKVKEELKLDKWEKNERPQETEILIKEPIQQADIEYSTAPPTIAEEVINDYKKKVVIGSDIHYTNILAYIDIHEAQQNRIRLYHVQNEAKTPVQITEYQDTNKNGLIDRIMWVVPGLSTETYIIEITKADHLDNNREFISDIYEEVRELDGNWSETIPNQHYVRVTFEKNLTNENDITVYPRIVSGNPRIEIYEVNGNDIIAEFTSLSQNQYNKVLLTNLQGSQDTFDLKVQGGSLQFDHIVDPPAKIVDNSFGCDKTSIQVGETTNCTGDYGNAGDSFLTACSLQINNEITLEFSNVCGANNLRVSAIDVSQASAASCTDNGNGTVNCVNWPSTADNVVINWTLEGCAVSTANTLDTESVDCNDQFNNNALDIEVTAGADTTPPTYSNIEFDPANASSYSVTQYYEFNVTWTDNVQIDTAYIVFDDVNYSAGDIYNLSSVYSFNRTGLSVGREHNYTWFANDSNDNENQTELQSYTVVQAEPGVNLTLDGNDANLTITMLDAVNITATQETGEGDFQLFQDGVLINEGQTLLSNSTNFTGEGDFNITSFHPDTENFTTNFTTFYVISRENITPVINLTDPLDNNVTLITDSSTNLTFLSNATDNIQLANATLYHNLSGTFEANETVFIDGIFNETAFSLNIAPTTSFIWNVLYCDNATSPNCAFGDTNFTATVERDTQAPIVNLTDPLNNNITSTDTTANLTFLSNATDNLELANATLYHNLSGTFEQNQTTDINGTFNETAFSIDIAPTTTFIWNVLYCDAAGNCDFAVDNFTATVQPDTVAPIVEAIDGPGGNTISDQSVTEDNITDLEVTFTVTDDNGVADLDFSTVNITLYNSTYITTDVNYFSQNTSCNNNENISATQANFTCNIEINYWYTAGDWNITAGVTDISGFSSENATNMSIQETTAIAISPTSITFPELTLGAENITSDTDPITINNTANDYIDQNNTRVTGLDLVGEVTDTQAITAENFTVSESTGETPPVECSNIGDDLNNSRLINNTAINVNMSVLPAGNRSIANEGVEQIYFCIPLVPDTLLPQAYSTLNSTTGWTVSVI